MDLQNITSEYYNNMKKCCSCNKLLSKDKFGFAKSSKDGYKSSCRDCLNIYSKKYWKDNKEYLAPILNEQRRNAYKIKSSLKPKKEIKPNKLRADIDKDYYAKNKHKVMERYARPEYRIKRNASNLITKALKYLKKSEKTKELIGIELSDYKEYLECLFDENMTWENYGSTWHIDHIVPVSFFNLSILGERIKAFNYKNTRPLEKHQNLRKNNKSTTQLYDSIGLNLFHKIIEKNLCIN